MKYVNAQTFKDIIESNNQDSNVDFVNVCTPAEHSERHISGVRNVPLDELTDHLEEFTEGKTVYIVCNSGNRAKRAVELLESSGSKADFVILDGGIMAWKQRNYPIISDI